MEATSQRVVLPAEVLRGATWQQVAQYHREAVRAVPTLSAVQRASLGRRLRVGVPATCARQRRQLSKVPAHAMSCHAIAHTATGRSSSNGRSNSCWCSVPDHVRPTSVALSMATVIPPEPRAATQRASSSWAGVQRTSRPSPSTVPSLSQRHARPAMLLHRRTRT